MTCRPLLAGLLVLVVACAGTEPLSSLTSGPSVPSATGSQPDAPTASTKATEHANALHLLILGDSIAIPEMGCGGCVGFDRQYATYLEGLTGRPVVLDNQARPDARISSLQSVLDDEGAVQDGVANADVVVVSIGYNNTPPWAPDLPCNTPPAEKDADLWPAIVAMTPECIDATIEIFGKELDSVYATIEELAAGRSQIRVALGSFNNLKDNPGGDGTIRDVSPEVMAAAYPIFEYAIDTWNKADCVAATAHGFACGDLYHAFNGPDGTGSIKELVNPADFVHPSEAGQAVIAGLLQRVDVSSLLAGGSAAPPAMVQPGEPP